MNSDSKNNVDVDNDILEQIKLENKQLQENLINEQKRSEEYLNRLKYLQADFDNYRKKILKDMEDFVKHASEKLIYKLLDILDDLGKAIKIGTEVQDKKDLLNGITLVFEELKKILEKEGLKEIDSAGVKFNPNEHEAVKQIETNEYQDNIIIEELRKGYTFKGKVIRPSLVKVAKNIINVKMENMDGEKN